MWHPGPPFFLPSTLTTRDGGVINTSTIATLQHTVPLSDADVLPRSCPLENHIGPIASGKAQNYPYAKTLDIKRNFYGQGCSCACHGSFCFRDPRLLGRLPHVDLPRLLNLP